MSYYRCTNCGSSFRMALSRSPGVSPMIEPASYSAIEALRDGRKIEIRALRPQDRHEVMAAVDRSSPESMFRRFLGTKRHFTEPEIAYFMNADFVHHVALVALANEDGRPVVIGGGRYIVAPQTASAEVAFAVIDQYQRQGIGAALMRHLVILARNAGVEEFVADVLASSTAMLRVFENSGLVMSTRRESEIVHVIMSLEQSA